MAVAMIELDDERHYNRQGVIGVGNCGMRVSKHQAAENRERILLAASRLLRERGVSGAGVDALSDAAGMNSRQSLQPVRLQGAVGPGSVDSCVDR